MTRSLHDGRQDGLEPLESLDVRAAERLADLLERMARTAFGGRGAGRGLRGSAPWPTTGTAPAWSPSPAP